MSVSVVLVVVMGVLFASGVYLMLERSLTRVLLGFLLLGNAANLLLLIAMGEPGVAPFFSSEDDPGSYSDALPQALTLTAIVITFAVSAFLLALIYRSWQLAQADTVEDDAEDVALRERATEGDESMEEAIYDEDDDEVTTDFMDADSQPITLLGSRDIAGMRDDAPTNRRHRRSDEPTGEGDR